MKNILSPSILSGDFWRLGEQISEIEKCGVEYLHIDVMDGFFVPTISYGHPVIRSLRKKTNLIFDVHLMINQPERLVEHFAECGADIINFHVEACEDIAATIDLIHSFGKKAGITIKPGTPVADVVPYLSAVDMVLIMTVEPGKGGQKLIPECLDKVRELRAIANSKGLTELDIEVDGGITADNVKEAIDAGANVIVAGSAAFKEPVHESILSLTSQM